MSVLWQSFYGGGVSIVNAILPNNTYLKGRNTTGTPLNLIGVDLANRVVVGGNASTFAGTNLTTQTIVMPDTLILSAPGTVSALLQLQTAGSPVIQIGVAGAAGSIVTGSVTGDLAIEIGSGIFKGNVLISIDGGTTNGLKFNSSNQLLLSSGTAALPGLAGLSFATTGLFWTAGPLLNFSVGAATALSLNATLQTIATNGFISNTGLTRFDIGSVANTGFVFDPTSYSNKGAFGFGSNVNATNYFLIRPVGGITTGAGSPFATVGIAPFALTIGAGTSSLVASLFIDPVTINLNGNAVTDAYALIISGAPAGATRNGALWIQSGTGRFDGGISIGTAQLLTTTVNLTNNAAAQAATLLNGPTAGNPTKWFPINDNGTIRNIPAW